MVPLADPVGSANKGVVDRRVMEEPVMEVTVHVSRFPQVLPSDR